MIIVPNSEPTVFDVEREKLHELQQTIMDGGIDIREMAMQGFLGMLTTKSKLNALIRLITNDMVIEPESISAANIGELNIIISSIRDQLTKPIVAGTSNIEQAIRGS